MKRYTHWMWIIICVNLLSVTSILSAQTENSVNAEWVRDMEWKPDGSQIAFATQAGLIQILDSATGQTLVTLQNDATIPAYTLAWSPDGTQLASAGEDRLIQIWDTVTSELAHTLSGHTLGINSIKWSPDGTKLASVGYYESVRVWEVANEQSVVIPFVGDVISVEWKADGTALAVGGFMQIQIWDANTYQSQQTIQIPSYATFMAWTVDGTILAVADARIGNDPGISLWDVNTGELLRTFEGHSDTVTSVAWSIDENFLASTSHDGTVRLWDVSSGQTLEVIQTGDSVFSAAFSPFGGRLAYGVVPSDAMGLQQDTLPATTSFAEGAIQIVVPAPPLERLQAIQAACMSAPAVGQMDAQEITLDALPEYVAQVEALTDAEIPPGCAADLVAIAEALIAEGQ